MAKSPNTATKPAAETAAAPVVAAETAVAPQTPITAAVEEKIAEPHDDAAPPPADTVPMMFPRPVNILDKGIMHKFKTGVQRVPVALKDHWYLKHNDVVGYTP